MTEDKKFFNKEVENALAVLRSGGVILYPTDTIWGLGCDATNATAVSKIYRIKKREDDKQFILLMADERQILKYVSAPDLAVFDFLENQSRPTTAIFDGAIYLPDELTSDGTIAIRIVKDEFCRHLIKRLQKPIVSTSANISGQPPPSIFPEISDEIKKQADHIVQWRQNDLIPREPSQIIKWLQDGTYTIIRS
ncbi:MAG TPA: L-threonylcarbamoyladenylate synthase [Chitinophagaceae bacterium]|nr:L-threonylcarbamoyladenylate synthase [Chitinophagaceae bacterium]